MPSPNSTPQMPRTSSGKRTQGHRWVIRSTATTSTKLTHRNTILRTRVPPSPAGWIITTSQQAGLLLPVE